MIYTCTITPSIDYTTYLPTFRTGDLNRTEHVAYYPGGKGINVSRVLSRLRADTTALGFVGGFTGGYIETFLQNEGILTDFVHTSETTRINVKIKADEETEINGPGPVLEERLQAQLFSKLQSLQQGDTFVLAGRIPNSIPDAFLDKVGELCQSRGVHFVVDTSGPRLKKLAKQQPFLMKPNQEELGEMFDTTIHDRHEAHACAEQLVAQGITNVIVSMGGAGALFVNSETAVAAVAPEGHVQNTVGAGDSVVAGFLAFYEKGASVKDAFQFGVACGSATAFSTDLCERQQAEALRQTVKLSTMNKDVR
ncbi:1-phosphofructokinase [Lentibacillus cibarius]|uniref:Tagatose-6-phosphate kinase n=1 Tax=Lentibacillus cibarius TaxID=2583219 RepID=A0A549YJD5_9BACI|nr:1-phosphofructokinase [Lentibacillus cibarius]TMN23210.1 1-phosphofructokinase [Lentibacillus cibarius]TRM11995.1 1-phosphofructokinase [Lentibacillus cibarius]